MAIKSAATVLRPFLKLFDLLKPVGDLIARVWVAQIFLQDGWFKLQNWNSTVNIFSKHYPIVFLSPAVSAVFITAAELILSICLLLGLGGRIMIFLFFIFNTIMIYSYNFLWTPEGTVTLNQQIAWNLLLMLLMLHGAGKMSVDYWLAKRHGHHLR